MWAGGIQSPQACRGRQNTPKRRPDRSPGVPSVHRPGDFILFRYFTAAFISAQAWLIWGLRATLRGPMVK